MDFTLPDWRIETHPGVVRLELVDPPEDCRTPGRPFGGFHDEIPITRAYTPDDVIRRVFANVQYLRDHELREQFKVDGVRYFDPHDPSVTGYQKEWFVERLSAVRGY